MKKRISCVIKDCLERATNIEGWEGSYCKKHAEIQKHAMTEASKALNRTFSKMFN